MKKIKSLSAIRNYLPALRIVVIPQCNLNCMYCPPKGEDFSIVNKNISTGKLLEILNVLYKIGFRQFGFTGGEALLREDLSEIVNECSKFKEKSLKLYTNGILLQENAQILKEFDLIKVSLDSIDSVIYKEMTGKDKLKDVLQGIAVAKNKKVKIRVNMVLTQKNSADIFNLINFCHNKGLDLKILDLNCFDNPGYAAWKRLYKSPLEIINFLARKRLAKKTIYTTGAYGIPMPEFKYDGIAIRIKDTQKSSVYSPVCEKCKYFLCQEGLYQLTLTSDGKLKMCRHRPDIYLDLSGRSTKGMEENILKFLYQHYLSAKRVTSPKQVFLGAFGANGEYKR